MSLHLGSRRLRVTPFPTALAIVVFVLLAGLGFWQLDRAGEKRALLARFEHGAETVLPLAGALGADGRGPEYQRVRAFGRYDSERQFLLDGMVRDRQAGYHVLTPLLLERPDRVLIVNRGWVAQGASRETLPAVAVSAQPREVTGRLSHFPEPGIRLGQQGFANAEGWPRRVLYPLPEDLERALATAVMPQLLLLDPEAPDGFPREWRPTTFSPERHIAYAVQWFALAVAVAVIYLVLALRRPEPGTREGRA